VLIMSDGTPWRPLVHIEDIARAFLAALEAPLGAVHDEAFNVGRTDENFQVSDIARIVADVVPGSRIVYAPGGVPDPRSYRVDFDKIRRRLPAYEPRWTVRRGAEELRDAYQDAGLTRTQLESARFLRIKRVKELQAHGLLDSNLRQSNLADAVTLVVGS
jgi:nucleoside-diphosphate-sugar epimerase